METVEKLPQDQLQHRKQRVSNSVGYLATPRAFIRMLTDGILTPTEFTAAVAAWDHYQSPENRSDKDFTLSRSKLASRAMVGERQAGSTIVRLLAFQCLILRPGKVGKAATYRWNEDALKSIGGGLYPTGTTPVPDGYNTCTRGEQAPVPVGNSVYITTLLNTFKTSYTENSGDKKGAPNGASVPWEQMEAAAMAAITSNWHLTGGQFSMADIALILTHHKKDWASIKNFPGYLFTLLKDGSLKYELRKKNPTHPEDEAAMLYQLDNINRLTKENNQ